MMTVATIPLLYETGTCEYLHQSGILYLSFNYRKESVYT